MKKHIAFNPQEEEMIEGFITIAEKFLGLPRITWIRSKELMEDRIHKKLPKTASASCEDEWNLIWIDPVYHLKRPIMETYASIIHELIHIKFPMYSERETVLLTYHYTGIM